MCDDQGCSDKDAYSFPAGIKIAASAYLVVCKVTGFSFSIGRADTITLEDKDGNMADTSGTLKNRRDGKTWARLKDGKFDYVITATPGKPNDETIAKYSRPDCNFFLFMRCSTVQSRNGNKLKSEFPQMISMSLS